MFFFDTRTQRERDADDLAERRHAEAKEVDSVPWDPNMKFEPSLKIQGETYKQPSLFKVKPSSASERDPNACYRKSKRKFAVSPSGRWGYRERLIEAGGTLPIFSGNKRGAICFDSEVLIPMLHRGKQREGGVYWGSDPWMSFTPMEFFSLRPGIRMARGHTVVAGLGMGYQLEQVCAKRNVKKVTLVEEDEELVEWILPKLDLHGTTVETIIGDAHQIVPTLTADVALIDIFPGYGSNRRSWEREVRRQGARACREGRGLARGEIGKTWIWGA